MFLTSTELASALHNNGYTVIFLPDEQGNDYLYATWLHEVREEVVETLEVVYRYGWFESADYAWQMFGRVCPCADCQTEKGPDVPGRKQFDTLKELLTDLTLGGVELEDVA